MSAANLNVEYKSIHQLAWNLENTSRANVAGGEGHIGRQGGYIAPVYTTHEIISHTITVRYEGPVDLKDRMIKQITIPSFWKDHQIISDAHASLDKDKLGSIDNWRIAQCLAWCFCPGWICCLPCLAQARYDGAVKWRDQTVQTETDRLATQALQQKIAEVLKEADELVGPRLEYIEQINSKK